MGREPSGSPSPVPELSGLLPGFLAVHAEACSSSRDDARPYFAVQGGSGSAEAAERFVCRDVLKEHQTPEGALVSDDQHYDVIVIGSGAGGAHSPIDSRTGKRVLLLERGDYLPAEASQLRLDRGIRQRQVPRAGILAG